ncbi:MAG: glycoside hydrolase family 3 protein [Frankiales bacterium]|nr:MAG: glycoside hydrolase family 3 protein [Frankiales bacterium]
MRRRRLLLPLLALLLPLVPAAPAQAGPTGDPAGWTDRQLAAQLVLAGYDMGRLADAETWVRNGIGGIVLFGTPPSDLGSRLARLRATGSVVPFVASDEEGGRVQRLRTLLGPLPSAEAMGATRSAAQVRALAASYGTRMARLGVDLDLAPVADLGIRGYYIERTDRAFSADPATAGAYASAWHAGMRSARVAAVAKHWPGHGQASDTHDHAASTPPLSTLEKRDLLPFGDLLRAGIPAVMVGHLQVPGLTEQGLPATLSPNAYRYLRERAGPHRVLMTDSLSMGAISIGMRLTPAQAAVRALTAGADLVIVDPGPGPGPIVDAVGAAIGRGSYPRSSALASVRRVLAAKRLTNSPLPMTSLAPAQATTGASLTPTLSGIARDRIGGGLTARFHVRTAGSASWNVVNAAGVSVASGARASYRLGEGRLRPATSYEWSVRACNGAGVCAAPGPILRFSTR